MSDLDVLVITDDPPDADHDIHMVAVSPERFRERVLAGDDFAQWAVRFGIPVSGRAWWVAGRAELASVGPWPIADEKLRLAAKRLIIIDDLLAMGDADAAQYELRFAISLIARGILLRAGVFPLSRPELAAQLDSIGYQSLATTLRRLGDGHPMLPSELLDIVRHGRRLVSAGSSDSRL